MLIVDHTPEKIVFWRRCCTSLAGPLCHGWGLALPPKVCITLPALLKVHDNKNTMTKVNVFDRAETNCCDHVWCHARVVNHSSVRRAQV